MELTRWNPMREMLTANRMLDTFFYPSTHRKTTGTVCGWSPVVDVYKEKDHLVITAELPGVDKKDISVNVEGRVLTLKGNRTTEKEVKEEHYYRRERCSGGFERTFTLPTDVNAEKIEANFKDGLLEIRIPKAEELKTKKITIH